VSNTKNGQIRHLLSETETRVMDLIVKEKTPQQIAGELFLDVRTIRWYEDKIRKKYNTDRTLVAVIRYIKERYGIENDEQNQKRN
jgi:DNA-binding CsgD family transcriptional regulator